MEAEQCVPDPRTNSVVLSLDSTLEQPGVNLASYNLGQVGNSGADPSIGLS